MRAVIYARYSSDLQSEASIEDQIRLCREHIEKEGGKVIEVYADYAISGGSFRSRPRMLALLAAAKISQFDCVVAEALDRISSDLGLRPTKNDRRLLGRRRYVLDGCGGTQPALFAPGFRTSLKLWGPHPKTSSTDTPLAVPMAIPPISPSRTKRRSRDGYDFAQPKPWNKGKLPGAKPPLQPKHVWAVRTHLQFANRLRDLALFDLAIDSKLRGCDVVALKITDVAPHGFAIDRSSVRQRKTGRSVRFEITEQTRQAIDDYLAQRNTGPGPYLFPGRGSTGHLTTRQYARLLAEWLTMIGLDPCFYGTHSLRRTKPTLIYKKTGNLRAVQLLLGHTKIESTVRYLGIEVDDALAVAEQIDV